MTNSSRGPNPSYDQSFKFDIYNDDHDILLSVIDVDRGTSVLNTFISINEVKRGIHEQNTELWFTDENEHENPNAPALRLKFTYSMTEMHQQIAIIQVAEHELGEQTVLYQSVKTFISQLRNPFGFLMQEVNKAEDQIHMHEEQEAEEEKYGDHRFHNQEKEASRKFDEAAQQVAQQYFGIKPESDGADMIPWLRITEIVTWIFITLTMLIMFKRPAVLSLTVAVLALYVIHNPSKIERKTFRFFVLLIVFSWFYDGMQLFVLESSLSDEDKEDGGMEYKLRLMTRLLSYINLIFKLLVALIFWKDSTDFRRIIRQKNTAADEDIDTIVSRY